VFLVLTEQSSDAVRLFKMSCFVPVIDNYIKYSLDFLRPVKTAEAFEAVDWLADRPQQTWPQAGRR